MDQMKPESQRDYLLNLLRLFLADLGGHLAFLEWVKAVSKGEDVEGILSQCRRDPVVQPQVDAYLQWLSVALAESSQPDPAQGYREFLRRWTELGKAN